MAPPPGGQVKTENPRVPGCPPGWHRFQPPPMSSERGRRLIDEIHQTVTQTCSPASCAAAIPPATCRRYTRRRCLIGPIIASYRPTTSRRSTSSVTASIPPPASAPGPTGRSEPAAARRVTISSPPDRCPPGPRRCWRQQPSHRIGHLPPSQPTHPTATRGFGSDAERCWEG
jgi:hypothetical protein